MKLSILTSMALLATSFAAPIIPGKYRKQGDHSAIPAGVKYLSQRQTNYPGSERQGSTGAEGQLFEKRGGTDDVVIHVLPNIDGRTAIDP